MAYKIGHKSIEGMRRAPTHCIHAQLIQVEYEAVQRHDAQH